VAEIADRVMVIYAGQCVEEGPVGAVFASPRHPYTRGLLDSMPVPGERTRLKAIEGTVPSPFERPEGCAFAPRCPLARERCRTSRPELEGVAAGRRSRCFFWCEVA
jgi:oligopeptide/dipeptide ABC transporter ATP-binding protein